MSLIDQIKPDFMFSLHNAGFCGVYYYISHPNDLLYSKYEKLVDKQALPLHRGEPEAPFIKKLAPAFFQMFGIGESYDFYEENGVEDPSQLIKNGTSSDDYLRRITGNKGFTLVCEMSYFYYKALGDNSLTDYERRDLVVDANNYSMEMYEYLKPRFDKIRNFCPQTNRLYTTVEDGMDNFLKRHEPRMNNARSGTDFEVIPIQKLVKVQVGSALITIQNI
jgi:hypothetical protein